MRASRSAMPATDSSAPAFRGSRRSNWKTTSSGSDEERREVLPRWGVPWGYAGKQSERSSPIEEPGMKTCASLLIASLLACAAFGPAAKAADDDFYNGKSISLIIPIGPGGAYDAYARVISRHLSKYIPGNPTI